MSTGAIRAAGGVVWRRINGSNGDSAVEIALIHRPRYGDWSFPKGKLAAGESEVEGAVREVLEETGHRVRVGRPLGETRYRKASGRSDRDKVVRYWSMQEDGGTFSESPEVDELKWVSPSEAEEMLTHDRDREILDRFVRGPKLTGSVLLVRHASAGSRSKWEGDDARRPLDDKGWDQAQELVRLLSRFKVTDVISADYDRCVQTVKPFADAVGLNVKEDPLFSEAGYPGREDEAAKRVRELGRSNDSVVICSQGDVIPDLLQRLAKEDHVDVPETDPAKGSVMALTFDGDRLFSVDYFPPPKV